MYRFEFVSIFAQYMGTQLVTQFCVNSQHNMDPICAIPLLTHFY